MDRRASIPKELDAVRAYREEHRERWGGMWLSYPTLREPGVVAMLNIAVTDEAPQTVADLNGLIPEDLGVNIVTVPRTEDELSRIAAEILGDTKTLSDLGATINGVGRNLAENVLEVEVDLPSSSIREALEARYGREVVRVVQGGRLRPDTCTRTNCGPPWKGGIKIYPSGPAYCSSGFVIRRSYQGFWVYAMWTAGHCASATWREGSASGTIIGTTAGQYFDDEQAYDIQVIPISAADATNKYIWGGPGCSNCTLYSIFYSQGFGADEPGDPVCNHGAVSGTKCGTLVDTDYGGLTYLGTTSSTCVERRTRECSGTAEAQ